MNTIQMTKNDMAQLMEHDLKSINDFLLAGESDLSTYNPTIAYFLTQRAETAFRTAYIGNDSFDFTLAEKTAVNDDLKSYHERAIALSIAYFCQEK
mgnify:CR=1 FL=1